MTSSSNEGLQPVPPPPSGGAQRFRRSPWMLEQVVKREPDNMTAITWLCLAYHCLGYKGKAMAQQSILQSVAPDLMVTVLNR